MVVYSGWVLIYIVTSIQLLVFINVLFLINKSKTKYIFSFFSN